MILRPRSLGPEHLEACLGLDRSSLGGLWTQQQWRIELADPARPAVGLWEGGELAAMACGWLVLDEIHVTLVAVAPGCRRRGLGRRVLATLLERSRGLGARRATLEVAAGNTAALALYSACGFRVAGVRRGYYRSGEDALIQWVTLDGDGGTGSGGVDNRLSV